LPFVAVHGLGGEPQHLVHKLVHDLGIQALGQMGRICDVTKQHGDLFAFSL
jgi:hypothetical protein